MREENACEVRTQLTIVQGTLGLIKRRIETGKPFTDVELQERLKYVQNATTAILVALGKDSVDEQAAQLA